MRKLGRNERDDLCANAIGCIGYPHGGVIMQYGEKEFSVCVEKRAPILFMKNAMQMRRKSDAGAIMVYDADWSQGRGSVGVL